MSAFDWLNRIGAVTYWPLLFAMPFCKRAKRDLALLGIMIAGYVANMVLPTSWILAPAG